MIKRLVILVITGLLLMPATFAFGDVAPWIDDPFFAKHERDCVYENRYYTVNNASGSVDIVVEPGSSRKLAVAENGTTLYVMFTYTKGGKAWGVGWPHGDFDARVSGWFSMEGLEVQYDNISFFEDFKDELYSYTGDYHKLEQAEDIIIWSYPGSGEQVGLLYYRSDDDFSYIFSSAYRDTQGREWGFISYYLGQRNVWVCISDPGNASIPAFGPGIQGSQQGQNGAVTAVDGGWAISRLLTIALICVLVFVVVVTTAILIWVFYRRGKKSA
ncbi:MAG: hypothetical protein FWF91_04720 [Coriobacteriia bacterium]|nr:hypothetical protein [Coriobacteriia bacterium]